MTEKDAAAKAKQHDLEETPRQRAARLTREVMKGKHGTTGLQARWDALDNRLQIHGRFLSEEDQRATLGWLERRFELTRTLLEGVGQAPDFSLPSESLDGVEWEQD